MRLFDVSDVLSVTTGRLVSSRHMDGIYDVLNFLTGDNLFTHQLPRAMTECRPWLQAQFPELLHDAPRMAALIAELDEQLKPIPRDREQIAPVITAWVELVRVEFGLPHKIPMYELGSDLHTRINPIEEAEAMFGKDRVIVIDGGERA